MPENTGATGEWLNERGIEIGFDAAIALMDDDIREMIHSHGVDTDQEFIEAYAKAHAEKFGEDCAPLHMQRVVCLPQLIEKARTDPGLLRDYGRPGCSRLSDSDLAALLRYAPAAGRNTIRRLATGGSTSGPATVALEALLSGWRPEKG